MPLAAGVTLADGRVGVVANGRGGVLAVGRAEVLEDEGATGVTGAAGGVTGEELADHSSSKRPSGQRHFYSCQHCNVLDKPKDKSSPHSSTATTFSDTQF